MNNRIAPLAFFGTCFRRPAGRGNGWVSPASFFQHLVRYVLHAGARARLTGAGFGFFAAPVSHIIFSRSHGKDCTANTQMETSFGEMVFQRVFSLIALHGRSLQGAT